MARKNWMASRTGFTLMFLFVTTLINGCGGKDEATTGATTNADDKGVLRVLASNPRWLTTDGVSAAY